MNFSRANKVVDLNEQIADLNSVPGLRRNQKDQERWAISFSVACYQPMRFLLRGCQTRRTIPWRSGDRGIG
jgi:hypothetical protein